MKRKPERYSFKKLASIGRKNENKYLEQLKNSQEKNKSQPKNRSSDRVPHAYETNSKFKIAKPSSERDRQRIRTEHEELNITKSSFHKLIILTKREKDDRLKPKITEKARSFIEGKIDPRHTENKNAFESRNMPEGKLIADTNRQAHDGNKNLNLKKLHFNAVNNYLEEGLKNSSIEKDVPLTGKHYSFRKAHQSQRGVQKRTALQKYVSESLENLETGKKKNYGSTKQADLKNTVKKTAEQIYKEKPFLREEKLKEPDSQEQRSFRNGIKEQTPKISQEKDSIRRLKTEKEQSQEKIEIKWERKKKNVYDLSKQEMQTFGDRFPDGFDKLKLLGRGGFSLVWLGEHKKSKKKYAIKQIITESSHQTHIKQIWFGTYFFEFGGAPKEQFSKSPGIIHLVKLYYYFINKKDTWILYEKCGDSLGNALYDLKSEAVNGEKIYRIHYKPYYTRLREDQNEIRKLILHVAKALELLAENNIVHSDLKTENILVRLKTEEEVELNPNGSHLLETKLIDYGSSFVFNNLRQFSMATPEYMAPEILNFILYENEFEYIPKLLEYVQKYTNAWVIDVWSLGSVLLEIVSGIPLWMSLKTIVKKKSVEVIKFGLFAIKGRAFDRIIKQQLEVVQNLDKYLAQQNYSGIVLADDLKILLKKMLALNPARRISPTDIIEYLRPHVQQ